MKRDINNIVIIPCGFKKAITISSAKYLYLGPYFKSNLKLARALTIDENIYILSAKHGLLKLNDKIEPYNLKMGMKGSVSFSLIQKQAINLGIINKNIIAIGGKEYLKPLELIFKNIQTPLKGLSMGYSMQKAGELIKCIK